MLKNWLEAFRLRTLPLALSCIGMGSFLAAFYGNFSLSVCILSLTTTLFLQILSNLANDYGDSVHGADSAEREGPQRSVQRGSISSKAMFNSIIVFAILSFVSGIILLHFSVGIGSTAFYVFLGLGLAAIAAAIAYTNGKRPYGYSGLGDISVFIFFGLVGVCGTYFLHAGSLEPLILLPAASCGLFATGVLNINNIRDIKSDKSAGKNSVPVRIGEGKAIIYHTILITLGCLASIVFLFMNEEIKSIFNLFPAFALFVIHLIKIYKAKNSIEYDPQLKHLALSTLLFVVLFGISILDL
ncbi:1,4-dihydroxy-2-naphthoate octaprenyltransferase [Marivirga tractuosa]|uniref:1,4-dihydroxy-2-naphthoate octaprenyltransferase n=1 Tax=Marivirga tractuosa (strain ATCC 23168 / DSM 4126 / NBRC 15989 / NCIMB 1408 / VKM B-1430 / H-43) TaxID=643867 RepID=E4TVZ5_MARTH|nr:1,4-dihydroxy-2-naphthoate polyprenyltransferase [Marivirga tractuosa]ADR23213.1 1,4-dihydroxy-2-naphtoate prenyltransferase [Marivirga tractuosa DSM 4126]BDD16113.1 1,4-dihydroxy-2-naphthoate octaprenyltransferase [Marivirga tractuosa]